MIKIRVIETAERIQAGKSTVWISEVCGGRNIRRQAKPTIYRATIRLVVAYSADQCVLRSMRRRNSGNLREAS